MARKGPNWKRIEELRDYLKSMRQTKYRKFDMVRYIELLSGCRTSVTVRELRDNGPECGSAACLAGWAVIQFSSPRERFRAYGLEVAPQAVDDEATRLLGLNEDESDYMFSGFWSSATMDHITKADAVRYLTKVLKERNVMVELGSREP